MPALSTTPEEQRRAFKVIFVGDEKVGKTSLLKQWLYTAFFETYTATIGIDFTSTMHACSPTCNAHIMLWDASGASGHNQFRHVIPSYIRDASLAVVVYDITDRTSFRSVEGWIDFVRRENLQDATFFLVGNKSDLDAQRVVSMDEGEHVARRAGAVFFETSAKLNHEVPALFRCIVDALICPGLPDIVVTVHATAPGPGGYVILTCTSLCGDIVATLSVIPEQVALADLSAKLADQIKVPTRTNLRLVLPDGTLLDKLPNSTSLVEVLEQAIRRKWHRPLVLPPDGCAPGSVPNVPCIRPGSLLRALDEASWISL